MDSGILRWIATATLGGLLLSAGCAAEVGPAPDDGESVAAAREAMMALPDEDCIDCADTGGSTGGSTGTSTPTDSCSGRCGGLAPAGCSCAPGCDWHGTCCRDVRSYCGAMGTFSGLDYVTLQAPRENFERGTGGSSWRYETTMLTDEGSYSYSALTRVIFGDIDSRGERSRCRTYCTSAGCYLQSVTSYDDNKAFCGAAPIRNTRWGQLRGTRIRGERHNGGTSGYCLGGTSSDSIAFLDEVDIEDVDDGSEWAGCMIRYVGGTCGWKLYARADDDSDAFCGATLLRLNAGMYRHGSYRQLYQYTAQDNSGNPVRPAWFTDGNKLIARRQQRMLATHAGMCYLTRVYLRDVDDGSEKAGCRIVSENGYWTLTSDVRGWDNDLDSDVYCEAECVAMAGSSDLWPPRPSWSLTVGGAHVAIYESGAYDKPVVFVEGFDPGNGRDHGAYLRQAGDLFTALRGYGYDVAVVDLSDGGQDVRDSALEVAKAIDYAYRFRNWDGLHPGREIAVIGVSMGALATRVALSSWEQGSYYWQPSVGGGYLYSNPPVSTFISHVGPHFGANIPLSLQVAVQDYGDLQDVGDSMSALNSHAAVNMLTQRIDRRCHGEVSQWCDGGILGGIWGTHGDYTIRKSASDIAIRGWECSLDTTGCVDWGDPDGYDWYSGYLPCREYATPSASFYADVNARGLDRNGFPRTVTNIGLASAGWRAQGCANNQDGACRPGFYQSTFSTGTVMADMHFTDSGHSIFGFCDRDTHIYLYPRAADLRPGDLTERTFNDLAIDVPSVASADIHQNFNMMFIPTESALGCPGAWDDASCAARTRFDAIHRVADGRNGVHGYMDRFLAGKVFYYLAGAYD